MGEAILPSKRSSPRTVSFANHACCSHSYMSGFSSLYIPVLVRFHHCPSCFFLLFLTFFVFILSLNSRTFSGMFPTGTAALGLDSCQLCWEQNSGPSQEQQVFFTTEPSPQCLWFLTESCYVVRLSINL